MPTDGEMTASEREHLIAMAAVRCGLVSESTLRDAIEGGHDPGSSLSRTLVDRGLLTERERALIEALLAVPSGTSDLSAGATQPEAGTTLADVPEGSEPTLSHAGGSDRPAPRRMAAGERFRVIRVHARGGLGQVSLAADAELRREVALKEILPDRADDPDSRARFVLEAEVTGRLEHPGIVPVYSLGADARGRPFYAMRFVRGESLKEAIERFHAERARPGSRAGTRLLELRGLLTRFVGVCEGVEYAHSRGVIHRDIKPANILLGPYGETLLVDWGLAKVTGWDEPPAAGAMDPEPAADSNRTVPGSAVGTPAYMSPEQAAGRIEEIGPATDVYGLGATLFTLLTGRPPWQGSAQEVIERVRAGASRSPRAVNPGVPKALEAVVRKAMAPRPADRYPSARALGEDINRWLADEPVTAWREPVPARFLRWLTRHRAGVTAAGAAGLVALVALAIVLIVQSRANVRLAGVNADLLAANRRARERFTLALGAARQFHGEAADNPALNDPALAPLRRKLLGSSLDFYQKLQGALQGDPDPTARADLAAADLGAAKVTAVMTSRQAAIGPAQRAADAYASLAAADPAGATYPRGEAEARTLLASLQGQLGQIEPALRDARRALRLYEQQAAARPDDTALRLQLAESLEQLADLQARIDHREEAARTTRRAIAIAEELMRLAPEDFRPREALARLLSGLSRVEVQSDPAAAMAALERALTIRRELVAARPDDIEARDSLAETLATLGVVLSTLGRYGAAAPYLAEALTLRDALRREQPSRVDFQEELANILLNYGAVEQTLGHRERAIELGARARDVAAEVVAASPGGTDARIVLSFTLHQLAGFYNEAGDLPRARDTYREALAITEETQAMAPQITRARFSVAIHLLQLGIVEKRLAEPEAAQRSLRRGITICEGLLEGSPEVAEYASVELHCLIHLLPLLEPAEAVSRVAAARRRAEGVARHGPDLFFDLACCEAQLVGRPGAGDAAESAMASLRRAVADGYRNADWMRVVPMLASLRDRPDFQDLIRDLTFPADPFAR
jgi:serine/threonine-protein kinase